LLRPYDLLVTARSTIAKAALVPPSLPPAVANSTLAVVRPTDPDLSSWLWWFLTSRRGRTELESRMVGSTVLLLRSGALEDVDVPVPSQERARRLAALIETSERARSTALAALHLRHESLRDAIVEAAMDGQAAAGTESKVGLHRYRRALARQQPTEHELTQGKEARFVTH
jgi:hypothetical protein